MVGFLTIGGVDMTPFMQHKGFKWTRADLDSEDTQRLLSGNLDRHRVTTKYYVTVTCKPLSTSDASIVLTAIKPAKVSVRYLDPEIGDYIIRDCYANNIPAQVANIQEDDTVLWDGIEFQLTQY